MYTLLPFRLMRCHSFVIIIGFSIIVILFSSCISQRYVEYLQDNRNSSEFDEAEFPDYKLKANDELFLQITSLDDATTNLLSSTRNQSSFGTGSLTPYSASLQSYSVNKEGYVMLPLIGNILVKDKTLSEISMILKDSLTNILNQPIVTAKLVNRYISVLGEVRVPGHYSYAQEKLSFYDAISLAGDITEYGDRNNAILLRNEDGKNLRISVDLTKSDILASNYYNLRPNDIIYIRPLPKKFWGMRQFPFNVVFSTISAITSILVIYNIYHNQ